MTTNIILGMNANYNANSQPQLVALLASKFYIHQAIDIFDSPRSSPLIIADFGSSHGRNSTHAINEIIEYLRNTKKINENHQILVIFNDLPTNHWTTLFEVVSQVTSYYPMASGRTFYEQCLPSNCLSIGYSSTAIHWLSCKPCNISDHCYVMFSSDKQARLAFERQAYLDYNIFLQHRSRELHQGGILILAILCCGDRGSSGCNQVLELLYKCAQTHLTNEELLEYTYPYYNRTYSECVNHDLFAQNSFKLIKADFVQVGLPLYEQYRDGKITLDEFAHGTTNFMRSWSESPLQQALKSSGQRSNDEIIQILNQFWTQYEQEMKQGPQDPDNCMFRTFLILKRE